MATYFGVTSVALSVWVMTFMAQNYFITGSMLSPCRITGVGLYVEEKVNFSEASNVCNRLNLQLASKEQVEKALKHGFETCSSGWIKDGLVAIPRITSNKKCGQGNVGLVNWRANQASKFTVYCFNSSAVSDECIGELVLWQHALKEAAPIGTVRSVPMQYGTSLYEVRVICIRNLGTLYNGNTLKLGSALNQILCSAAGQVIYLFFNMNNYYVQINSCKPDPTTTVLPASSAPTDLTAYSSSDLTGNTTAMPATTEPEQTLKNVRFRRICITETILPTEGTTTKIPEEYYTYPAAFRNDAVVFGGIPTTLLVLAVVFFIISVLLAVCYVKKYQKSFPFSNKKQKKDVVETTALKEAASNDKTLEKETKNNGKKAEEDKAKPETTAKCLEVEV